MSPRFLLCCLSQSNLPDKSQTAKGVSAPRSDSSNYTLLNIPLLQTTATSNIISTKEFNTQFKKKKKEGKKKALTVGTLLAVFNALGTI